MRTNIEIRYRFCLLNWLWTLMPTMIQQRPQVTRAHMIPCLNVGQLFREATKSRYQGKTPNYHVGRNRCKTRVSRSDLGENEISREVTPLRNQIRDRFSCNRARSTARRKQRRHVSWNLLRSGLSVCITRPVHKATQRNDKQEPSGETFSLICILCSLFLRFLRSLLCSFLLSFETSTSGSLPSLSSRSILSREFYEKSEKNNSYRDCARGAYLGVVVPCR